MFIDRVPSRCGPSDFLALGRIVNRKRRRGLYEPAVTVLHLAIPESAFIVGKQIIVDSRRSQPLRAE
jgi:hypothetical protein